MNLFAVYSLAVCCFGHRPALFYLSLYFISFFFVLVFYSIFTTEPHINLTLERGNGENILGFKKLPTEIQTAGQR